MLNENCTGGDKKSDDWKRSYKETPFIADSIQLVQWIPYLEGFGDFKKGGQVICIVKYANDLVLLAKKEEVLQGMI